MMNHNPQMLRSRLSFAPGFNTPSRVILPAATLLVWSCVAFTAVVWSLRWSGSEQNPHSATALAQVAPEFDASGAARALGAVPVQTVAPTLASRFQLLGVMAGGPHAGAALISVQGQAAKPYRVGAVVADGLVLQSVQERRVNLGALMEGASTLVLELPAKK